MAPLKDTSGHRGMLYLNFKDTVIVQTIGANRPAFGCALYSALAFVSYGVVLVRVRVLCLLGVFL